MYAVHDPLETLDWMIREARAAYLAEDTLTKKGDPKKKSKVQRDAERVRLETLIELAWNVSGRAEPIEEISGRLLAA